ncbi:MAG: hypothetical protein ACTHM1_07040 [Solirubrobacteraceae bacterium]
MVVERSSSHPVEYAILLLVKRKGAWYTVRAFENAHHTEEHHEHRYVGTEKQPPVMTYGSVNAAMQAAESKLRRNWPDIVRSWESAL